MVHHNGEGVAIEEVKKVLDFLDYRELLLVNLCINALSSSKSL